MSNSPSNNKTEKNIKDDLECRASKPPSPSFVHFLHGTACSSGKSQAFLTWVLETRWCRQRWLTQLTFGRKGWWRASHWAESAFWQWWSFHLAGWRVVTLFLCLKSCQLVFGHNNLWISFGHTRFCAYPYGQSFTHHLKTGFADLRWNNNKHLLQWELVN